MSIGRTFPSGLYEYDADTNEITRNLDPEPAHAP
jgi:hypothetical protein